MKQSPSKMSFAEYQKRAVMTAAYKGKGKIDGLIYCGLGLGGESGELLNKLKKILRDNNGKLDAERRMDIIHELGDCLWYLSQLCNEIDIDLASVAHLNLGKLASRLKRGVISGSGDNR